MFGSLVQGDAAQKRGRAANDEAKRDAASSETAAADAIETGNLRDMQEAMKGSAVEAAAMVQQSGSGFDVNVGAPLASRLATRASVEVDRSIVRRNAALQAYGLRLRARAQRQQGEYAEEEGNAAFVGSFLSGLTGGLLDLGKGAADKVPVGASSGSSTYQYNGGDPN